MARSLVFVAACLFTAGCAGQVGNVPAAQPGDTLDVYEAVFRYRLQRQPADVTAYLSVDGEDPSEELLKRLRKDWPNLKPVSEEPKEKGLHLYVKDLKWEGRDRAELKAGYSYPTKFAPEGYFADHHVVREKERWVVEKLTNETSS